MSPLSTVLPPPAIEYVERIYYPAHQSGNFNASVLNTNISHQMRPTPYMENSGSAPSTGLVGAVGGALFTTVFQIHKGRPCAAWSNTNVDTARGSGWLCNSWYPGFGPAAGYNPGAIYNDASVVAIIDWNVAVTTAGTLFGDDRAGFIFIPHSGAVNVGNSLPQDATNGGFGVFINDDGAGVNRLEYVSWDLGGAILERVPVGALIVPDITDWNTVRFIILAAASGREATLTVEVNGSAVLSEREFGSAELNVPNDDTAIASGAQRFMFCMSMRDLTGSGNVVNFQMAGKFGRFTPSGAEQQGA